MLCRRAACTAPLYYDLLFSGTFIFRPDLQVLFGELEGVLRTHDNVGSKHKHKLRPGKTHKVHTF